jgi:protein-glucosylgalactosylhydroxylysine glucosidase
MKQASSMAGIESIPRLTCTNFAKTWFVNDGIIPSCPEDWFASAYLGNGFIGVRPGPNPLLNAKTVVGGFVAAYHDGSMPFECYALAPYPLETDILASGMSMLANPQRVTVDSQTIDMSTGELLTTMVYRPTHGVDIHVEVMQFASRTTPSLLCQEIVLSSSTHVEAEIRLKDKSGLHHSRNTLGIALTTPSQQKFDLGNNTKHRFHVTAAMVCEFYHPEPRMQALRLAGWAKMLGFKKLREQNRAAWSDLWKGRVKVLGDPDAQRALDVAFFYMHSSAHPACRTGIPPFGLSQYKDYEGHVFWDMDHWVLHAVLPISPPAAKAMLEFRSLGLPNAQNLASLYGLDGAQFPLQQGSNLSEVTIPSSPTGWGMIFTPPVVALAFWEYVMATDDREYLRQSAWPVIREVAKWIESRGEFTFQGFEIRDVIGIDDVGVQDNNSFNNVLCRMVMQAAIESAKRLGLDVPAIWERIRDSIVVAKDKGGTVVLRSSPADPSHTGEPVYAPGMLQMLFWHDPSEYGAITEELLRATYEHEEDVRRELPAHYSNPVSEKAPGFTAPPFAVCAAFYGDRKKAAEIFRYAWERYWVEPYGVSREYQNYHDGEYLMNHASLLQAAIFGFTGLRIRDGDWAKYPASLPAGWERIEIERIWVRGKPMRLIAEQGKKAELIEIPE